MSETIATVAKLLDACSEEDRRAIKAYVDNRFPHPLEREWGVDADTILSAIGRSSDLTKRGVRGIIAEAVFVHEVIPSVAEAQWIGAEVIGDQPYDAVLRKGNLTARIQVKLQRLQEGAPKLYYPNYYESGSLFVVEVQKTRTGEKRPAKNRGGATPPSVPTSSVNTRPYAFGDFDVLAVNMHPSTRDWKNFRYTVASWLLPRSSDRRLIEILQPVAAVPNDIWTDDLLKCLRWFESGKQNSVLSKQLHPNRSRATKRI